MPDIDTPAIRAVSDGINADLPPKLEEANPIFPEIRELDQMLMVSVDPMLAAAHALASGYMIAMVQGAADCFTSLTTALQDSVTAWEDADEAAEQDHR